MGCNLCTNNKPHVSQFLTNMRAGAGVRAGSPPLRRAGAHLGVIIGHDWDARLQDFSVRVSANVSTAAALAVIDDLFGSLADPRKARLGWHVLAAEHAHP